MTRATTGVPGAGYNLADETILRRRRPMAIAGPRAMPTVVERPAREPNPESHQSKSRLEQMEESARMAQLQAMMAPPPMRMVSGPGIIPGYMPDVNAMNYYQRQAYLPKESSMNAVGAVDDTARSDRNQGEFQNFMTTTDQRRAIEKRGGGSAGPDESAEYAAALELARKRRNLR